MPDMIGIMAALHRIAAKATDMAPAMHQISGDMLDAVRENFDKEGRPEKWHPLAPSTPKRLEKKGTTSKMLNRSAA